MGLLIWAGIRTNTIELKVVMGYALVSQIYPSQLLEQCLLYSLKERLSPYMTHRIRSLGLVSIETLE